MGHSIPEADLKAGKLAQYLVAEDYAPIKNVSEFLIYLLGGSDSLSGCLSDMFLCWFQLLLTELENDENSPKHVLSR